MDSQDFFDSFLLEVIHFLNSKSRIYKSLLKPKFCWTEKHIHSKEIIIKIFPTKILKTLDMKFPSKIYFVDNFDKFSPWEISVKFGWFLSKCRRIHLQHFVNNVVLYCMDWLNKATGSMLIEFWLWDVSGSSLAIDNLFLQSSWLYFVYISCTIRVTWHVDHMTLNYIKHLSKRCEFCSINIHKKCMPQG